MWHDILLGSSLIGQGAIRMKHYKWILALETPPPKVACTVGRRHLWCPGCGVCGGCCWHRQVPACTLTSSGAWCIAERRLRHVTVLGVTAEGEGAFLGAEQLHFQIPAVHGKNPFPAACCCGWWWQWLGLQAPLHICHHAQHLFSKAGASWFRN